jgi:hypothetical protein
MIPKKKKRKKIVRSKKQKAAQFKSGPDKRRKGKTKGAVSGRKKALRLIDEVCSDVPSYIQARRKLKQLFATDPLSFYRYILIPLIPKEMVAFTSEDDKKKRIFLAPFTTLQKESDSQEHYEQLNNLIDEALEETET